MTLRVIAMVVSVCRLVITLCVLRRGGAVRCSLVKASIPCVQRQVGYSQKLFGSCSSFMRRVFFISSVPTVS